MYNNLLFYINLTRVTMTSLSQKILQESFILEAIKPESTLSVSVYSAFTCLFCSTLPRPSYRLLCIVVNCDRAQKCSLPLPEGELYFLFPIISDLAMELDLADRRWEVMYVTSSPKHPFGLCQALFFLCPGVPDGRFSASLRPREWCSVAEDSSPTMDPEHKHVETQW